MKINWQQSREGLTETKKLLDKAKQQLGQKSELRKAKPGHVHFAPNSGSWDNTIDGRSRRRLRDR